MQHSLCQIKIRNKCPSIEKYQNKVWYIHEVQYYVAVKNNEHDRFPKYNMEQNNLQEDIDSMDTIYVI